MNINSLLDALNPSRKVLLWITATTVAAIPTVWFISSNVSTKKVMDNVRLDNLETSIGSVETKVDSLTVKFVEAEKRFTYSYESGVEEVGKIIKESDRQQTSQIKFLVNNWSESNRALILEALELRQDENENKIDELIKETKKQPYKGDPVAIPLDDKGNEIHISKNIDVKEMDNISRNYKLLSVETNPDGSYNMTYREYTQKEKEDISYFNK